MICLRGESGERHAPVSAAASSSHDDGVASTGETQVSESVGLQRRAARPRARAGRAGVV